MNSLIYMTSYELFHISQVEMCCIQKKCDQWSNKTRELHKTIKCQALIHLIDSYRDAKYAK